MKFIKFLKNITFFEILINTVLAAILGISGILQKFEITTTAFWGIAVLHILSMGLHWFAWNIIPVTHKLRSLFNIWVAGSFALVFICFYFNHPFLIKSLYMLAMFAIIWFFCYCIILIKEFRYLKRKQDLYEKRELIHF